MKWSWKYFSSILNTVKWDLGESFSHQALPSPVWEDPTEPVWKPNRDINRLYLDFAVEVNKLLKELHENGVNLHIFESRRSFKRQQYLYEQGRTRLFDYKGNPLRIVTKAPPGFSMHQYGLAVDLVFDKDKFKSGMQWTWDGDYKALGEIIKKYPKLEWAGNWKKFKEFPHVQYKVEHSILDLYNIYKTFGSVLDVWNSLQNEEDPLIYL